MTRARDGQRPAPLRREKTERGWSSAITCESGSFMSASVAVKIEAVSIDIFHSELAQTPGLHLERLNNSCTPRAQFLVSSVDVRGKYPVNSRFEWAACPAKENRDVIARDGADVASRI